MPTRESEDIALEKEKRRRRGEQEASSQRMKLAAEIKAGKKRLEDHRAAAKAERQRRVAKEAAAAKLRRAAKKEARRVDHQRRMAEQAEASKVRRAARKEERRRQVEARQQREAMEAKVRRAARAVEALNAAALIDDMMVRGAGIDYRVQSARPHVGSEVRPQEGQAGEPQAELSFEEVLAAAEEQMARDEAVKAAEADAADKAAKAAKAEEELEMLQSVYGAALTHAGTDESSLGALVLQQRKELESALEHEQTYAHTHSASRVRRC